MVAVGAQFDRFNPYAGLRGVRRFSSSFPEGADNLTDWSGLVGVSYLSLTASAHLLRSY